LEPFFSVIIPTRDRVELLKRALKSIERQTFRRFEVLVIVDNASSEEIALIESLLSHMDMCGRLIALPAPFGYKNGPYVTRNVGLREARAQYCAFCDDDDLWVDPRHLEKAYEAFCVYPDLEYYFANQVGVWRDQVKIKDWLPHITQKVKRFKKISDDTYLVSARETVDATNFPHLNSTIVAKRLAIGIGGFWENLSYSGDFDFFLRGIDKAKRIAFRQEIVSQHNIPDRTKKDNVSAMLSHIEKQMTYITIGNHIRITCSSHAILMAVGRNTGYALKHAAVQLNKLHNWRAAWFFARQALVALPSWKWAAFTLWLGLKRLFDNRIPLFAARVRALLLKAVGKKEKTPAD